jgi:energy-coupling factor transporter ATP-binding protein EcfA2
MAVEVPFPFELFLIVPALLGGVLLAVRFAPAIVTARRQAAYETVIASERVRLELAVPANQPADPQAALELIRTLHPRQRRGVDGWRVGWPPFELRALWRDGELVWQLDIGRQMAAHLQAALRSLYPGTEIELVGCDDQPPVGSAVGSLVAPAHWPFGDPAEASHALVRLASLLEQAPIDGGEVRLRLLAKPIAPERWQRALDPDDQRGRSFGSIVGQALIDTIFNRPSSIGSQTPVVLSPAAREAQRRKRAGQLGFEVGLLLEVAGMPYAAAKALLWQLIGFSDTIGDGRQAIAWAIRRGGVAKPPRINLGDWELARLWQLPDAGFDQANLPRQRPLAAPPPAAVAGHGSAITIGETRQGPLSLPVAQLARHLAVFGATGSGKSTLLLNLALGVLDTPIGATVIDPHGDLSDDILSRVPPRHAARVHVLRLADKAHPRGFNFLERREPDEAQLVTSEFVLLLEDLWGRYCGPKMQNYLRHALLTMLAHPGPQTVLELVRVLTDDDFRAPYLEHVKRLDDPMLVNFWRTQWPSPANRERDPSIAAVLNKLGAFVAYQSIRNVVGQGVSSLRPRQLMDAGDLLVVDLSGVGGDNANLFGAMLISRYYIDAVGRQGTPPAQRRQHLLIVDEAQRFSTRAVDNISVEGRKFGLALALATQSFGGLNERLRNTLLTNAATLALLSPGADDVHGLARLFAPLREEDLLALPRHELVLRMPGPAGRPAVYGGRVCLPGAGDPQQASALIADSDRRDARPLAEVRAEISDRTAPLPAKAGEQPRAKPSRQARAQDRQDGQ